MRVFKAAGRPWEARSHIFPASTDINPDAGAPVGFDFSVGEPKEVGDRFSNSFAVTPFNPEHIGVQNVSRAEAFAVAERVAMEVVGDMERNGVSLRRWTDVRSDALLKGQAAVYALERRRRLFRRLLWAGICLLAVSAMVFALTKYAGSLNRAECRFSAKPSRARWGRPDDRNGWTKPVAKTGAMA